MQRWSNSSVSNGVTSLLHQAINGLMQRWSNSSVSYGVTFLLHKASDGLMWNRSKSSVLAIKLHLFCIKPSTRWWRQGETRPPSNNISQSVVFPWEPPDLVQSSIKCTNNCGISFIHNDHVNQSVGESVNEWAILIHRVFLLVSP